MNAQEIYAKLKSQFGDAVGALSEAKIDPFRARQGRQDRRDCQFAKTEAGLGLTIART